MEKVKFGIIGVGNMGLGHLQSFHGGRVKNGVVTAIADLNEKKSNPVAYTFQIFIVNVWKAPGYGIVMYKAAMMNVDPGLYEAAELDGAGSFTQFRKITLPAIAPTTFYLLFAGLMAGLMTFDIPKIFVGNSWDGSAGVQDAGLSIVLYSYIRATTYHDIPGASVMSFTLFIICFILSLVVFKVRSKLEGEDR